MTLSRTRAFNTMAGSKSLVRACSPMTHRIYSLSLSYTGYLGPVGPQEAPLGQAVLGNSMRVNFGPGQGCQSFEAEGYEVFCIRRTREATRVIHFISIHK